MARNEFRFPICGSFKDEVEAKFADMLVLPFLSHCHHLYPIHAGIDRSVTIYWSAFEVVIR